MRYSRRHFVSLRTLGLACAVALSPALMQQEPDCTSDGGETRLQNLELLAFEGESCMPGDDMLTFDPQVKIYQVEVSEEVSEAMLIAEPMDPEARVMTRCYVDGDLVGEHMSHPTQRWGVVEFPEGDSTIHVEVTAPGGATTWYAIDVHRF